MSRHPSPGPSHASAHISQHPSAVPSKQKQKPFAVGIAAGAEDVKYQAKYKDLKRKVKEIENDNDKLYFKVLQAKRSIQRMKLERAILYERLAIVPPSPEIHDRQPLPQVQAAPNASPHQVPRGAPPAHQQRDIRDHPSSMEPDPTLVEYLRTHGNPRVAPGPDGRPVPVMDAPTGPGVAPSPHPSAVHSPRRTTSGHESARHLPPLQQPHMPSAQYEGGRGQSRSHSQTHTSPPLHHSHTHAGSPHERHERHERNKSHSSSSRSRSHQAPPQPYQSGPGHQQYSEGLPPVQHVLHSPPLMERERSSRRHDIHELAGSRGESRAHSRNEVPLGLLSPRTQSSEGRSSGRIHNHQRLGPGTYINADDHHERHRDMDRERERDWERDRERERDRSRDHGRSTGEMSSSHMHSPHMVHRSRQPIDRDYHDHHMAARIREEQAYYNDMPPGGGYPIPMPSRSGSPGSISGDGASHPDSRAQFYEHDRARSSSYRLRPVTQPNEDIDFVHEDGRSQSRDRGGGNGGGGNYQLPEHSHPSMGSRKRNRNDMEVDSDNDVAEGHPGGVLYSAGRLQEDGRGSKRYHREHPRQSVDNHEDSRMGPS